MALWFLNIYEPTKRTIINKNKNQNDNLSKVFGCRSIAPSIAVTSAAPFLVRIDCGRSKTVLPTHSQYVPNWSRRDDGDGGCYTPRGLRPQPSVKTRWCRPHFSARWRVKLLHFLAKLLSEKHIFFCSVALFCEYWSSMRAYSRKWWSYWHLMKVWNAPICCHLRHISSLASRLKPQMSEPMYLNHVCNLRSTQEMVCQCH